MGNSICRVTLVSAIACVLRRCRVDVRCEPGDPGGARIPCSRSAAVGRIQGCGILAITTIFVNAIIAFA